MAVRRSQRVLLPCAFLAVVLALPAGVLGGHTEPTGVATTTSVVAEPATSSAGSPVRFVAQVSPNPNGGRVEFIYWTAASGGVGSRVEVVAVNSAGRAIQDDDHTFLVGTHWIEARFLGTSYFAPSSSARFRFVVNPATPGITMSPPGELPLGEPIQVNWTVTPHEAAYGVLELLVDDSTYASRPINSSTTGRWIIDNLLEPGIYSIRLRLVSSSWKYGTGTTPATTLRIGNLVFSSSVIDYDRYSTRTRSVVVNSPRTSGDLDVTDVRLSNSSAMQGGLLADGSTFARQDALPWTLDAGADGTRTVWSQLKRSDGSWSGVTSDTVQLDTTPPSGSFIINGDAPSVGDVWGGMLYEQELTGSATDNSLAHGGAISHVAMSDDGTLWRVVPFTGDPGSFNIEWQVAGMSFGGDGEDGIKTVHMRWRDRAGNWSATATDTIELFLRRIVGRVLIDGKPGYGFGDSGYVGNSTVNLTFPIDVMPTEGMAKLTVRGAYDGARKTVAWQPGVTVSWSLTSSTYGYTTGDGVKRMWVELISKTGRMQEIGALVILDRAQPTSGPPRPILALDSVVDIVGGSTVTSGDGTALAATDSGTPAVAADIRWSASDNRQVASHRLQRSLNGGTWASVTLVDPTVARSRQVVKPATTFRFRSRSVDAAGNRSSWRDGPSFKMVIRQDTSDRISYSGGWKSEQRADAFGGTLRTTTSQGASATLRFTGRSVSWVAPRMAGGDAADVYVDGKLVKTVHLSLSSGYHPRRIVFSWSWSTSDVHTIRIVKKFNNANKLPLDAFIVLN